jgi:uncharacterized protein with PIN domain
MIITKSKICIKCNGRIRLIDAACFRPPVPKVCPNCGQIYVRSRLELAQQSSK